MRICCIFLETKGARDMSLRDVLKRKMPATFNAVEYETGQVLDRLDELSSKFLDHEVLTRLNQISEQLYQTTGRIEILE